MGVNDINVLYFAQPPVTRKPPFLSQFFCVIPIVLWYVNIRNCVGQANWMKGTWHFGLRNVHTIGTVIV